MSSSIFSGNSVKILKNILKFKDNTELSSTDAANISGLASNVQDQLDNKIETSEKGANNGVAELDGSGKVPASQLPSAVMSYLGTWDASTNTPTLADGVGDAGDVYTTSVAGTQDLGSGNITFSVGDWVIYNGTIWEKSGSSSAVVSVNGQSGVVALTTDDIPEGTALYFTDELAQDAVGNILAGSPTIDSNYDDVTPEISFSVAPSSLTDTHISASANINRTKIAATNANRVVVNDSSGVLSEAAAIPASRALESNASGIPVASAVTSTELGYVSGVTSAIQTQINGKEPTITTLPISKGGTNSSTALADNRIMRSDSGTIVEAAAITANRALVSDASGIPVHSTVTNTELGYVSGVTSALQTQLAGKVSGPTVSLVQGDNCNFATSLGSWVTYANTASEQPVDGTGGSPSVTISRTTNSSEVLNGVASLKLSKDAANRQGNGASLDISVPNYAKGQPCKVSFSAKATSNFDFGTPFASNDPSDVTVYLYDVTNSKLLQPYPYTIMSNMGYEGAFQIPSDCSSLRLILHITTTNATAYDLVIDDVEITANPNISVPADSDAQDVGTMTITATTTSPTKGTVVTDKVLLSKRGEYAYITYTYSQTTAGTAGSGDYLFHLPSGLKFNSSKVRFQTGSLSTTQNSQDVAGRGFVGINSTQSSDLFIVPYDETRFRIVYDVLAGATAGTINNAAYHLGNANQGFNFTVEAPIQGWTSGQVTAASANLNAPAVFYGTQSSEAVTGGTTNITFTSSKDTVLGWSTNIYTVKVPGDYQVSYSLTSSAAATMAIYKNNALFNFGSFASAATSNGVGSLLLTDLVVGDTISVRSQSSVTVTNGKLTIARISTSSGVYKTRVAYIKDVKSSGTDGGTFTSGSFATRTLNTLEGDTSFISLASNQFTLQPGTYQISASAPGFAVVQHKAKLRNTSDGIDTLLGTSEYANATNGHMTRSFVEGTFSITVAKTFEIQHRANTTRAANGYGAAASFGDSEVYTVVKIEKVL